MPDVILPALNEREALKKLLPQFPAGYRAIVVDNASTDDTSSVAKELGALVVYEPKRGFGAACFAGLMAATDDIICFMDADGSIHPKYLPDVVAPISAGTADLVLGARIPSDRSAWPLHLRMANRYLAWKVGRASGAQISDLGPLRAARRKALIDLELQDRRFGWPLEMVLAAGSAGWKIQEVPIPYEARVGKSKVTGTLPGLIRTVRDMQKWLKNYRGHRGTA